MEEVEIKIPAFRVVTVFDYCQTDGKELPGLGVNANCMETWRITGILWKAQPGFPCTNPDYEEMEGDRKALFY